ncbi:MAG: hypothetical protein E7Z89_03840 [Cyanobacteria bacterium SIG28]|nr:hypothetical protein [Cyanobacteria bacterium SIG28]
MLKIGALTRNLSLRRGNGIARKYYNAKNMRNMETSFAATEFLLSAGAASKKDLPLLLLTAGLGVYFSQKANKYNETKLELQEKYQEIVDRAKQIYNR